MKNLRMGVLLHFYQSYWQLPHVLKEIVEQCYRPIFRFVRNSGKGFAFTANINYSLLELLKKYGYDDVLDDIKYCVQNNLIELVGTAAYHPIIPLIPIKHAGIQIAEDSLKKKFMGITANSKGFFFPEMAFSKKSLPLLRKLGFNWTVIEDVAVPKELIPRDHIICHDGFNILLRSSHWSEYIWNKGICFDEFAAKINYELPDWTRGKQAYIIIAMDAETFGHHISWLNEAFLFPLIENWGNGKVISRMEELIQTFPHKEGTDVCDCSWATNRGQLSDNNPFPLWDSKYNPYHLILWNLAKMALKYCECREAIHECFKVSSSCHWWWISGGEHWNPGFMIIGARKAYEVVDRCSDNEEEKRSAQECLERLEALCHH